MRKNTTEKTAKVIDAAKPAASSTAAKAKKTGSTGRVVKSAQQAAPPRISLAALAAMDTTPKAGKVSKTARPAKPVKAIEVAKAPEPAKLAKTPKLAKVAKASKVAEIAKIAPAVDVTDAATEPGAANSRRTLRGIKLAWNLDAAATDASKALSTPVAQEVLKVPAPATEPVNVQPLQPKPTLKVRPATPRNAPKSVPQPSFLAGVWAYFRNPSGVTLAGLAGLAVALAFFAATQDGITNDNSATPPAVQTTAMAGPNDAPALYSPWDYPPAVPPPYPGPDYGNRYNYHEGRIRH